MIARTLPLPAAKNVTLQHVCIVNGAVVHRSGHGVKVPFQVRDPGNSHKLMQRKYEDAAVPSNATNDLSHPILWSPVWIQNFAETFLHNSVPLFAWLRGKKTEQSLILDTHDLRAPKYLIDLVAPFSSHSVHILKHISPRCFPKLTIVRWVSTSFDKFKPAPVFETGRFVGTFYDSVTEEPPRDTSVVVDHRSGRRALRIPIETLCASISPLKCITHNFGTVSLAESVRLMRQTRILIGVHGAGLANAFFMPRPSVLIEIRPYAFEGGWPDLYYRDHLTQNSIMHMTIGMADPRLCQPILRFNASAWEGWNGRCAISKSMVSQAVDTASRFIADPSIYKNAPFPTKHLTQLYHSEKNNKK